MISEGLNFAQRLHITFYRQAVFQYGCGEGRLASVFSPQLYYGGDESRPAVMAARSLNPGYTFVSLDKVSDLCVGDVGFVYDRFALMSEDAVSNVMSRIRYPRFVIIEAITMDRGFGWYADRFRRFGYDLNRCTYAGRDNGCDVAMMSFFHESVK